jgi:hypothetical protein
MNKTPRFVVNPPAVAAKEGRPYHTVKGHCNRAKETILLYICCLVTAAGAVAENRKYDYGYDGEEYDDNQDLDCSKQDAPQGDYRA